MTTKLSQDVAHHVTTWSGPAWPSQGVPGANAAATTVTLLVRVVMRHGQLAKAQRLVAQAMQGLVRALHLGHATKGPRAGDGSLLCATEVVAAAVDRVSPRVGVRPVRRGGTTFQVPWAMRAKHQQRLALTWLVAAAQARGRHTGMPFGEALAVELQDAWMRRGAARQRRDEMHRLAEANRAYARFRWW